MKKRYQYIASNGEIKWSKWFKVISKNIDKTEVQLTLFGGKKLLNQYKK